MKLDNVSETDEDKESSLAGQNDQHQEKTGKLMLTKNVQAVTPDSGNNSYFEDLSIQTPLTGRHFKQTGLVQPSQGESPDPECISPLSPDHNHGRLGVQISPTRLAFKNADEDLTILSAGEFTGSMMS